MTAAGDVSRRNVLAGVGGAAIFAALYGVLAADKAIADKAAGEEQDAGVPFSAADVLKKAEALAAADFATPTVELPAPFDSLTATQYRDIRFRSEATLWRGQKLDRELQLLPLGWIYNVPVEIHVVEGDKARPLKADARLFAFGASLEKAPENAPFAFSGFRLSGPLNRAEVLEDFVVFQGASYFRAVGRGETYGLSARGLALNTAQPSGEEFPLFREFWIERPRAGGSVVVHALLDSPSASGAYSFTIAPGEATTIDVAATLYPRRKLTHVGLAPLTSMYLHGPASRHSQGDVRPAVHNSEGLAILNGKGERLWRPLTNPRKLQTSAFMDQDPGGFGLAQRDRSFSSFEDLNAQFERRPTVWVEPKGSWGPGYVELVEIPAEEQIHDNIVAYWKPAKSLEPGAGYPYAYRLTWGEGVPAPWTGARVRKTRLGQVKSGDEVHQSFIVDFDGSALEELRELPKVDLAASWGAVSNLAVVRNPHVAGVRVSFELDPADAETVELRMTLRSGEQLISEAWLFRWSQS